MGPRARLVILAPDPRHPRRSQADFPLIGLSEFPRPLLRFAFPLAAAALLGVVLLVNAKLRADDRDTREQAQENAWVVLHLLSSEHRREPYFEVGGLWANETACRITIGLGSDPDRRLVHQEGRSLYVCIRFGELRKAIRSLGM